VVGERERERMVGERERENGWGERSREEGLFSTPVHPHFRIQLKRALQFFDV
jgi:hypothetical protein